MTVDLQPETEPTIRLRRPGAVLIARVLGAILCIASGLKLADLLGSPVEGVGTILTLLGSSVELLVGAAMLFRIRPNVSVLAGGLLFVMLAGVSLIGTTRGIASCGCLGAVTVPPWVLLAFDVGAAIALLGGSLTSGRSRIKRAVAIGAAGIGTFLAGLGVGAIVYPHPPAAAAATSPEAVAAAGDVAIDPDQLKGRPFVLIPFIQIDADLSRGEWKIILARPGCRLCERRLRGSACEPRGQERVAVVLADDKEGWTLPEECKAALGHLSREKTWVFHPPLIVRLVDGRVTEAF
jgi:hypothetical protein